MNKQPEPTGNLPDDQAIVSQAAIHELFDKICGDHSHFKANDRFYAATGINSKRWAKLWRGELSITVCELKKVCDYLKVEFTAKTFARQLKLFEDEP